MSDRFLDVDRLGSLYGRLIDQLIVPDAERQARAAAQPIRDGAALHPWYPVLRIGGRKAELSKRALVAGDPSWLLRVSVHLELLTFLGVAEAVRPEGYELLSPAERAACEDSQLARCRARLNRDGWQAAWEHRTIAWARRGRPRTGAVAAHNVLRKRRATFAFLAVHHEDLLSAIELAGPNHGDAQQALQQVFSDAERAVLHTVHEAFPELWSLPAGVRDLALHYRRRSAGLFASAAKHYRRSLNAVAAEALRRQLVTYAGAECIPPAASVIETADRTASGAELLLRLEPGRR